MSKNKKLKLFIVECWHFSFPKNWEITAFKDIQLINLGNENLPLVGWKQIVLLKLYAGSEADLYDAKRIISAQEPGQRALDSLKEKCKKLRLSKKFERAMAIKGSFN